jgi:hypothetical protein
VGEELRQACAAGPVGTSLLRLDLAAVTFADAAGLALLNDLKSQGVGIAVCSAFVAELLNLEETGNAGA